MSSAPWRLVAAGSGGLVRCAAVDKPGFALLLIFVPVRGVIVRTGESALP
jgi:hypothetical protein